MPSPDRHMAIVMRIITGALAANPHKVEAYTRYLADTLEQSGDPSTASRVRALLHTRAAVRPTGDSCF